jgi:hypothetical protein
LFAGLNALEAVTLAVLERRGLSGQFWRGLGSHGEAIDEAYEILRKLRLATPAIRSRANSPTAVSGSSRSRWHWQRGRRFCCSTNRRRSSARGKRRSLRSGGEPFRRSHAAFH